jgi:very-short-patch-repair endonuclease
MPFQPRNTERARELRNRATPAERALWRYLSRSQLGAKFSRQMPVGPYFADFLCREHKLVIELDGHSHDIDPGRDIARDRYLRDSGFRVLRFANADVLGNVEGVILSIRAALADRPTPDPSREREGG